MNKFVFFIISCLFLTSCASFDKYKHYGKDFIYKPEQTLTIAQLDKEYIQYIRAKKPVRLKGKIKYQCQIRGSWAFIENDSSLAFIDFSSTSPNILLPTHKYSEPLIIEGYLVPDLTVMNNYRLIPYAYQFERQ